MLNVLLSAGDLDLLIDLDQLNDLDLFMVQSSPLIWSTDVRSTRLYGQLLAGPNHRTLTLISNPDIRSARLYGQFLLDKTLTLQPGSTVLALFLTEVCRVNMKRALEALLGTGQLHRAIRQYSSVILTTL